MKSWSPRALQYFALELKDGVKVAVYLTEEVAKVAANSDQVLMGYFIRLRPYVSALAAYFMKIWMVKGDLQVLSRGNGFLLFKFSEDEDKCEALEGEPRFVRGKALVDRL